MNSIRDLLSPAWAAKLRDGRVNIGLDVASTINKKSNPSAISVTEFYGGIYWQRLVIRFKTDDQDVLISTLKYIIESIPEKQRGLVVVDSSNEKFTARKIRKALYGIMRVIGIAGNNKVRYLGEDSDAKTALGAAYLNALEDGLIAMPPEDFIKADHRLVTRNGARFDADVDAAGNHADTFDACKLALWAFISKGHVSEGWRPALTSTFFTGPIKGGSALDQQRARLQRARAKHHRRQMHRYLSI